MDTPIAAGSLFTSCVTNTEPQGIKDIRQAKADYLGALAGLKNAEAAKEQAKADYIQAKVAYEQIMNQIAQCKADSTAAALKVWLKEQEQALAEAEANLKAALDSIAVASEMLSQPEKDAIQEYKDAYAEYIKAEEGVRTAQQTLWEATYQWAYASVDSSKTAPAHSLEETKAFYEKKIARAEEQIAKHQAKLEEYSEVAESERAKYDVWKAEYDAYADSVKNMQYATEKIRKERAYYQVETNEAFETFVANVEDADADVNTAVAKAAAKGFEINLTDKKALALPTQKVTNDVVGKFTSYVGNITNVGKEGNKISIADNKMSVVFHNQDSAKAQIFGTDDDAMKYSLSGIIDALKRDSVIVETFIKDTTGLAKEVAKAENLYKTTLDTLKAGVEAYPGVIKAKADSAAAGAALRAETAKFLAQQAAVDSAAADVLKQLKAYKKAIEEEEGDDFNINKIVKAIDTFSARKYAFFETPDKKKDTIKYLKKIGDPEDDAKNYITVSFDALKKAGFEKTTKQTRWTTGEGYDYTTCMDVASYMLTPDNVDALDDMEHRSDRRDFINGATPLLDVVNQALGTTFESFEDITDDVTIANITNWGVAKKSNEYVKVYNRQNQGRGFVVGTGGDTYSTSALKTAEAANAAAQKKVAPAYAKFYTDFYCKFWGIDTTGNFKKLFKGSDATTGLNDSLQVRYKETTFTGLINFDYTKKPWNEGKIDYEQINLIPNSELAIILTEFNVKPYYGSQQLYQGKKEDHKWTLYLKSLAAKAVLADAQNYSDNKKTLAALDEVVNKVKDAYNAAVTTKENKAAIALADSLVNEFLGKDIVAYALKNSDNKNHPYLEWGGLLKNCRVINCFEDSENPTQEEFQSFIVDGEFNLGGIQLEEAEANIPDYAEKIQEWWDEEDAMEEATDNLEEFKEILSTYVQEIADLDGYKQISSSDDVDDVAAKVDKAWKKFLGRIEKAIVKFEGDKRSAEQALAKLEAGYDPQQVVIAWANEALEQALAELKAAETRLDVAEKAYNQVIKNHE